jgi:competence protein ComEC
VTARGAAGPLLGLGATVAGILVGGRLGAATAGLALGAGVFAAAGAWLLAGTSRRVVAAVALLLLGTAVMQRAIDGLQSGAIATAIAGHEQVQLRGALVSDPDGRRFGASAYVRVTGVDRIVLAKASGDDAGRLRVLEAGDRVELAGRLVAVPVSGFDARARWSHASALLVETRVVAFAPADGPLARVANGMRAAILRGTKPLAPTSRALLAGFLLGDTRAIPQPVSDDYRASGLSHLLAVSGANVAFVLVLFAPLLGRLRLVPRTATAIAIVGCFAAATRFEPSVLRASALTTITILATFVGRPVAPLRALSLAIVALLLVDPFLLHSLGFHLSCAASAGIAVLANPLAARLKGPKLVREPLAVSIAAQVGVTPVLLAAFGSVPVITPVANLLAYPAAEALGVFALAASVIGGVMPPVGTALAPITEALLAWVTAVAHATAGLGGEIDGAGALAVGATLGVAITARRVVAARRARPRDQAAAAMLMDGPSA